MALRLFPSEFDGFVGLFVGAGGAAAFTRAWVRHCGESVLGRPVDDLCEPLAAPTFFALDLADEAQELGHDLGLLD
jgi:hypothetical protein